MKQGKTLQELAIEIERQSQRKKDFLAPTNSISFEEFDPGTSSELELEMAENRYPMTDNFHQQIGSELGIPKKYYDLMREKAPTLLRRNVNHWLDRSDSRRMIRTLDGRARAYLSEKYRPLDHFDLMEVALPEIIKVGCRVESCEVTESRLYLKAVTDRRTFEVKVGDVVQAGIVISNSEVGHGALKIEPMLFRLRCLNGLIGADTGLRKNHVGKGSLADFEGAVEFYRDETRQANDRAFWLSVRDTVASALDQINFEELVQRFAVSAEDQMIKPVEKVVEISAKVYGWSETERGSVLGHLMASGDLNRFGLINAVTRTAQDVPNYDRATEFERLGGQIIELRPTEWERLAA